MEKDLKPVFSKENIYKEKVGHSIVKYKYELPETREWSEAENLYLLENTTGLDSLIDFGCGDGPHLQLLSDQIRYLVGIDISETMIRDAIQRCHNLRNVKLHICSGTSTFFHDGDFECSICMSNTFGNIYGESQIIFLNEMKRVTKKGGKIMISVYSENADSIQRELYKKVGLTIDSQDNDFVYTKEGFKSERFSKEKISTIFSLIGLNDLKITPLNDISYMVEAHNVNFLNKLDD